MIILWANKTIITFCYILQQNQTYYMKTIYSFLFKPIDASIVAIFRIIFGLFMVYQMMYYYDINYTYQFIAGPEVLFPYSGLEFLKPLPLSTLKTIHAGLLISAILITLGFLYRYAIIFFTLGFSYFSFVDRTLYNNHIYLIALIAFVMIFIYADRKYSLRVKFSKKTISKNIPAWNQYILIFLLCVTYFFGGIAKLSPNWLDSNLVSFTISNANSSILSNLLPKSLLVPFIKYGGLLFDLSIPFILLNKKTRLIGLALVALFSFTNNSILFDDIGIFSFFMICSTILFFDSTKVGQFVDTILGKNTSAEKNFTNKKERQAYKEKQESVNKEQLKTRPKFRLITTICLFIFVVFHLIFPLRHKLLTSNPEWTGIASRFSWRMKMQSRHVTEFKMSLTDRKTSKTYNLDGKTFVSKNQFMHMLEYPYTFVHLAKYISKKLYRERGFVNPIIKTNLKVEFNGMPNQNMINPNVDLTQINESHFVEHPWITEFNGYK